MAENQAEHRQSLEETAKTVIVGDAKRETSGLWIGAFVAIFMIASGTFLVYNGHDWAGATMVVSTIAGVVGVFVYGTQSRRAERQESRQSTETTPEHREAD